LGPGDVVSPGLGSFGVYNFTVSHDGPNVFPFTTGAKRGHCVELTVSAQSGEAVLRSDTDATINTVEADRITWILLSSIYHQDTPGATSLTPDQIGAAHQSAVWQYTNVGNPGAISPDPAVAAKATEIVADAEANRLGAQQAPTMAVTGASAACGPGTRTVQVTGAPFSSAELSITSANGTFTSGGKTQSVELGPQGAATTTVSGAVGTISLSGTAQQAKGVAADFESNQDLLYANLTPVPVQLNIELPSCTVSTPLVPSTPVVPSGGSTVVTRRRANLRVTKRGPRRVRSGRRTTYVIRVRNTSRVVARKVVLRDLLPSGMVLARRTRGMSIKGRTVSIRIGSIGPRRTVTRRVVVSVLSQTRGRRCNRITVSSNNARSRGARTCTTVTRSVRRVSPAVTG
ncbi:MAG: thioester domain-containing protein, partial [Thermoleophilia bacterium]|nr:thioester domain-containing protein [Thermoleophilia bacterium]